MNEFSLLWTMLGAFGVAALLGPAMIPFLRRLKFGQSIREDGPQSHLKKSGTPTMGGLLILAAATLVTIVSSVYYGNVTFETYMLLFVMLGYGLLGFLDDYIKVVRKHNLGLTSKQKLIGQIVIAILFFLVLRQYDVSTAITVPGTNLSFDFGIFYVGLMIFMLVGGSNAVNLTDGLDGLLAGTASVAFGAFSYLAWQQEQVAISLFCMAVVGALLGFLLFNANPAKVFMGDTGSLALGGAITTVAILLKQELLLVIIGGIFVIETLSVIIQVVSFKTRGKRVFKMSPIHHHFELSGWSEWRVVITFWSVGALLAMIGILIEV